jgi:hypothetical protein
MRVLTGLTQTLPGKERLSGHKQLAFLIPFRQTTKLSLYCFTDFTFAITCPTASFRTRSRTRTRYLLYGSRNGTNIFIFKTKLRSSAGDWYWKLWYVQVNCCLERDIYHIPPGITSVMSFLALLKFDVRLWIPC